MAAMFGLQLHMQWPERYHHSASPTGGSEVWIGIGQTLRKDFVGGSNLWPGVPFEGLPQQCVHVSTVWMRTKVVPQLAFVAPPAHPGNT